MYVYCKVYRYTAEFRIWAQGLFCNSKCYNEEFRTKKHASFTTDEKQQSFSQIH